MPSIAWAVRSARTSIRSVNAPDETLAPISLRGPLAEVFVAQTLLRGNIIEGLVDPVPPLFLFRSHNDIMHRCR